VVSFLAVLWPPAVDVTVCLEELLSAAWSDHIAGADPAVDLTPLFPVQKSAYSLTLTKPPSAVDEKERQKVIDQVQSSFKWASLEQSLGRRGLYVVVTSAAPHYLLRASYSWYSEFSYTPADLGKLELLTAVLTEKHGPKSCVQKIEKVDLKRSFSYDLQGRVRNCVVLELQNRRTGHVGLYSAHCFPLSCNAHVSSGAEAGSADRVVPASNRGRNGSASDSELPTRYDNCRHCCFMYNALYCSRI
jgi:hypothetical protein